MLDITLLRKDLAYVVQRLEARQSPQTFLDIARFTALEVERKAIQSETESLQARRNSLSKQIGQMKGRGEDTSAVMSEVGGLGDALKASAERLDAVQAQLHAMLMALPNLPHDGAPVGVDESGNVELRRWGTPRSFDFAVKDHVDLGAPLGLDFDTGAKLSGSRFTFLRGPVARLHRALAQLMLDMHTTEHAMASKARVTNGRTTSRMTSTATTATPRPSAMRMISSLLKPRRLNSSSPSSRSKPVNGILTTSI